MLFAIHPVHVESVAWIAERRNVLSTFFWFAALLAYWRYARQPGFLSYLAVTVLFTLGLTAKSMLVTLPFQLLLLDFWPLERIHFKSQNSNVKSFLSWVMIEKIPLFAISALACYLTLISARNQGGVKGIGGLVSFEAIPLFSRMANAAIAYINYMIHLVFPFDLSVYYPYPNSIPLWQVTGASLLLISMLIVILRYAVRLPWLVTGWFWFMGTLVPVIGLVQLGGQAMADRYIYVPSIGIFIILVWGTATIFTKTGIRRKTTALLAVFFFTILASNTWMQLQYWKNSLTLFERTVRITPDYPVAYNNLGMALANAGRLEEASDNIQKAIQLMPVFAEAYNNLGNILSTQGNIDEAVENYRKALALNPDYSEAHNNLGIAYYTKQLTEEAIFHFQQALRLSPDYPDARHNLEIVLKKRLTGK
ncbi:MAG: tetratricopeptide repeat protein [Thermodesulfobacteriota bacterium]